MKHIIQQLYTGVSTKRVDYGNCQNPQFKTVLGLGQYNFLFINRCPVMGRAEELKQQDNLILQFELVIEKSNLQSQLNICMV